jgi:hypothetical protein
MTYQQRDCQRLCDQTKINRRLTKSRARGPVITPELSIAFAIKYTDASTVS